MPVSREDVERIIASVPGFQTRWEAFLKEWDTEPSLPYYLGMGELAHYVVEGFTKEFPDLFSTVEASLQNSHPEFENLITVGFFEDIQNIASHREFGADLFRQWLGTRSAVIWDQIDAYVQRMDVRADRQKPRWWEFWRRRKTFDNRVYVPEKTVICHVASVTSESSTL